MLTAVRVPSTVLSFFMTGRKVKLSLLSPRKHYMGNRGTAPLILNLEGKRSNNGFRSAQVLEIFKRRFCSKR
jgi:hypothetical protein